MLGTARNFHEALTDLVSVRHHLHTALIWPWINMTDNLMRRLDGFCRLFLTLNEAGITFPASGEILTDGGALCWSELDCGHLYVMMTVARRRGDRLAPELKKCALALGLLSFVTFVPTQDWEKTGLIECMMDPEDITQESSLGISGEPVVCVNLRAHLHLPEPQALVQRG